jgi:hypothetical protein
VKHLEDPDRPDWTPPVGRPVRASWLGVAAVLALLLIGVSFYYTAQWYEARSGNRQLVATAAAVASAHRRAQPLEIRSADPYVVLAHFDVIDAARMPERLAGPGETLLGGRLLRVEGQPFIELRYRAADGRAITRCLGALPLSQPGQHPDRTAAAMPLPILIDGVAVVIRHEQGLVIAEAS